MIDKASMLKAMMMVAYLAKDPHAGVHMQVESPAFHNHDMIPRQYTCDGRDAPIPLRFSHIPKETKSLALVMYDQDTQWPGFHHWEVVDLPASSSGYEVGSHTSHTFVAQNSYGHSRYDGPCPSKGLHHYVVRLYALDEELAQKKSDTPVKLHRAMQGHILASADLVGRYQRPGT